MPLLWLINANATFTLHLHGVVTKLLVQVVGSASARFACWQCHLDSGCFGTLCLASGHIWQETVSYLKVSEKSQPYKEVKQSYWGGYIYRWSISVCVVKQCSCQLLIYICLLLRSYLFICQSSSLDSDSNILTIGWITLTFCSDIDDSLLAEPTDFGVCLTFSRGLQWGWHFHLFFCWMETFFPTHIPLRMNCYHFAHPLRCPLFQYNNNNNCFITKYLQNIPIRDCTLHLMLFSKC